MCVCENHVSVYEMYELNEIKNWFMGLCKLASLKSKGQAGRLDTLRWQLLPQGNLSFAFKAFQLIK